MASDDKDKDARSLLAIVITSFSIVGITILSIVFIVVSPDDERKNSASQVFSGVLPLYGTWIGTLLAFYFAKENFDSATRNTVALSQISTPPSNNLEFVLVSSLIKRNPAIIFSNTPESRDLGKSLEEVKKDLAGKGGVLIVKENRIFDFLVSSKDIEVYLGSLTTEAPENGKTLRAFINYVNGTDPGQRQQRIKKKEVVFVSQDISLAKAEQTRKIAGNCQDIIVTENGTGDSPIIGYINEGDIDTYRFDNSAIR